MENATHAYFYLLMFFFIALLVGRATMRFGAFLGSCLFSGQTRKVDNDGYAGGFVKLSAATGKIPVRFAFIALLFVLFVAEVLLLLPWVMVLRFGDAPSLATALIVLAFWGAGYFYEYKKGAAQWRR